MYDLIQENHQPKENKLMKKIILLVCAITALCSCGGSGNQNEKKVREVVEAKLKTEMNDWSSYEFVSAEAIDTIKYIDNINYRKEYFQKSIENNKGASNYGLDYSSSITKDSIILIGIDSIQNAMGDKVNEDVAYLYKYKFRGKNKLGAVILDEYLIYISPNWEIIQMTNDPKKLYNNPGDFPGYVDLVKKNM
jgi:hypothetical protein